MSGNTNHQQDPTDKLNRRRFIGNAAATTALMFTSPSWSAARTLIPPFELACSAAAVAAPKTPPI